MDNEQDGARMQTGGAADSLTAPSTEQRVTFEIRGRVPRGATVSIDITVTGIGEDIHAATVLKADGQ